MMKRLLAGWVAIATAVTVLAGCSTQHPVRAAERTVPSDTELAIACGDGLVFERVDGYPTRADALSADLNWYDSQEAGGVDTASRMPYDRFAELLRNALEQLGEIERGLEPGELAQIPVSVDGTAFGAVEVEMTQESQYNVSALSFAPTDPDLCAVYDQGDFG